MLGIILLIRVWAGIFVGTWGLIFKIIGFMPLITSLTGFCPLYALFKTKTNQPGTSD